MRGLHSEKFYAQLNANINIESKSFSIATSVVFSLIDRYEVKSFRC